MSIVKDLDDETQTTLLNKLDEFQAVGMTPKQAQLEAAKETREAAGRRDAYGATEPAQPPRLLQRPG